MSEFNVSPYAEKLDYRKQGLAVLKCCYLKMAFNKTRVKSHFLSCWQYRQRFPNGYRHFNSKYQSEKRNLFFSSTFTTKTRIEKNGIKECFQQLSVDIKDLNMIFAKNIFSDGLPFSVFRSRNWAALWQVAFGTVYRPLHKDVISSQYLNKLSEDG